MPEVNLISSITKFLLLKKKKKKKIRVYQTKKACPKIASSFLNKNSLKVNRGRNRKKEKGNSNYKGSKLDDLKRVLQPEKVEKAFPVKKRKLNSKNRNYLIIEENHIDHSEVLDNMKLSRKRLGKK